MEDLLKGFEDMGYEVKVGWKEKERKKNMSEAIKKLKESGDEKKIKIAKTLARFYGIFNYMGYILNPEISLEEDEYEINYLCQYLDIFVDTAKISIAAVIKALGNDESLDPFCKYLMFSHMYTPDQVKEIGHEEIYRREQNFEKE